MEPIMSEKYQRIRKISLSADPETIQKTLELLSGMLEQRGNIAKILMSSGNLEVREQHMQLLEHFDAVIKTFLLLE